MPVLSSMFTKLGNRLSRALSHSMQREDLAAILSPFIADADSICSNEQIECGLHSVKDWLRTGFRDEGDKGALYDQLQDSLDYILIAIKRSNPSSSYIDIDRTVMRDLKHSHDQFIHAADNLEAMGRKTNCRTLPEAYKKSSLESEMMAMIYGKPGYSFPCAARRLRQVNLHLDTYFSGDILTPPVIPGF